MNLLLASISEQIKSKAREDGFNYLGFSKADKLTDEEGHLKEWLDRGYQGKMHYLENHTDKRLDPRELVPGAKSVISLLYNYYPGEVFKKSKYKIARYAYGKDYHVVIKERLRSLTAFLEGIFPGVSYRVFVDSAPVMEREWARRSGLGWIGKNTLLLNKEKGSYFFLAEIILDRELAYDSPVRDYCGTCTKCLDACPTDAFEAPYVLNASKCISYATIELKDLQMPSLFKGKHENYIFGCDICQEVCPWNSFAEPHNEPEFKPLRPMVEWTDEDWERMSEIEFESGFGDSPLKRTKAGGLQRNVAFVKKM